MGLFIKKVYLQGTLLSFLVLYPATLLKKRFWQLFSCESLVAASAISYHWYIFYPLETSENIWSTEVFQGYRKRPMPSKQFDYSPEGVNKVLRFAACDFPLNV